MTANQRIFCDEYIKTRNATQSYLIAYPNCKNDHVASVTASRMLAKAEISAYIDEQLNKMHKSTIADAEEIMAYYTSVIRGEITDAAPVFVGSGVQEIKPVPVRATDRNAAAEKLAKMLGIERKIDTEKLKIEKQKFEIEKAKAEGSDSDCASVVIEV